MAASSASEIPHAETRRIQLAVFDVDGVLTDGGLLYSAQGESLKRFDARDGLGLKLLQAAGIQVAILSARASAPLTRRATELGIDHCLTGCHDKGAGLVRLAQAAKTSMQQVAFAGDDLIDLPAMRLAGQAIAVRNAHPLVQREASWTTTRCGGDGAVREIAETLIGQQVDFEPFIEEFLQQIAQRPVAENPPFCVAIPARYGSSRLPGKPLLTLHGKPMVQHVYQVAQAAGAEQIVVATDDERIRATVEAFGGCAMMTSNTHQSGTDRIAEVAEACQWREETIVVNLQGDEPLLNPQHLVEVAQALCQKPRAGLATLAASLTSAQQLHDPNVVKVVLNDEGCAQYFSRAPIPWAREAFATQTDDRAGGILPPDVSYLRHIGLYAYRVRALRRLSQAPPAPAEQAECLEQLRALALGIPIAVRHVRADSSHGVDTAEDLARAEEQLTRNDKRPQREVR